MTKYTTTGSNIDKNYGDWMEDTEVSHHSKAYRNFPDVTTNVDVRSEYNRSDYDYYRPSTKLPDDPIEIIKICTKAYEKIGIVRNVIDLMSEFATQGIHLQHPIPSVQRFYNRWFQKVNGKDRSERFLNLFYREGNVIIKRTDAKLSEKAQKEWKKIRAQFNFGVMPAKYTFLSPTSLEVIGGTLANFIGQLMYRLKAPMSISRDIKIMRKANPTLLNQIPPELLNQLEKQKPIDLDPSTLYTYFYKKDDWHVWAKPMTYAIMDDLMLVEKMKLADLSALDGAISNIRLWRIGIISPDNPANNIMPTKAGINKFRNMLQNNTAGGTLDLVTGPEVEFLESSTSVHQFLGSSKYEVHLANIYDGMGIPPTLRSGTSGKSGTGNFVALKTLIERLQYGRDVLTKFWTEQIELVQKAMGFSMPAVVVFDKIILSDESVAMKILLELADRDYISMESLLEHFDMIPIVEKARLRKELKMRGKKIPHKAGPFHDPQFEEGIKRQLLLRGNIDPSEFGLDLKSYKPILEGGRPPNVIETQKRKPKPKGIPSTKALDSLISWSIGAYKTISDLLTPAILSAYNKSNLRKLTNEQSKDAEYLKYSVLCACEPFCDISKDMVYDILEKPQQTIANVSDAFNRFRIENQREPSLDEIRSVYISLYISENL